MSPRYEGVEDDWFARGVREAIHIRAHHPSLNKDGGRYQLPHIWDSLISNINSKIMIMMIKVMIIITLIINNNDNDNDINNNGYNRLLLGDSSMLNN